MRFLRLFSLAAKGVKQAIKLAFIKLRFGSKIRFSFKQKNWELGTKIAIANCPKESIVIGKNNNYRRYFQAGAVNGGKITLGDEVFCNTNVCIVSRERISIADNALIGNNVVIIDHDHDYKNGGYITAPITIDEGVWIGANSVILKGVHIGKRAVVAAGSVVTKDVPPFSLAGGGYLQGLSKPSGSLRIIEFFINTKKSDSPGVLVSRIFICRSAYLWYLLPA